MNIFQKKIQSALSNNMQNFDETNLEQMDAVKSISEGNNLFITGEGGTGKSHFISTLAKIFEINKISFRIVTPTGITAINLNESLMSNGCTPVASTYHSLYGFIPNRDDRTLHKNVKSLIKELDVLIIDEAPMIDAYSIDRMSFRHNYPQKDTGDLQKRLKSEMFGREDLFDKFFGDTQVIMFGDLFQLPPIVNNDLTKYGYASKYIFDSFSYKQGAFKIISFYKNYRVAEFADEKNKRKSQILKALLKDIRYGCISDSSKAALNQLNTKRVINNNNIITSILENDNILLSPYNADCFNINEKVKAKLDGKEVYLHPFLSGGVARELKFSSIEETERFLDKRFDTPRVLVIKIGQRVLITTNNPKKGFYNGDIGIVNAINTFKGDIISIEVLIKRAGEFKKYVIERKLYIKPTTSEIIKLNAIKATVIGVSVEDQVRKIVKNWIEQFPLKDGFAITFHRAQGKTFEKTIINPNGFGTGGLYVALSRNTNLDGILLTDKIKPSHISVDNYVLKFYYDNGLIEEYMEDAVRNKLNITI
jgi:hypothetical protein